MQARAVRWVLLLLVGGAIGLALGLLLPRFDEGGTPMGTPTPVLVTTTLIPAGTPAVPDKVEATRDALRDAARSGDYEQLRPLVPEAGFEYTFGSPVDGGPIAFWQTLERTTDERPLEALAAILKLPYVLSRGYYVWPWAYTVGERADLSEHERELLAPLGSPDQIVLDGTGYLGWRAGFEPDGTWAFFLAGD